MKTEKKPDTAAELAELRQAVVLLKDRIITLESEVRDLRFSVRHAVQP